mmetsp:Transcript_32652/g.41744  ORF Transcript_32652/g.41744 Transcript_32652/m.41744 type:complete len:365 (-) Transcript_32652:206-1300(-)
MTRSCCSTRILYFLTLSIFGFLYLLNECESFVGRTHVQGTQPFLSERSAKKETNNIALEKVLQAKASAGFEGGSSSSQFVSRREFVSWPAAVALGGAVFFSSPQTAKAELDREVASMFRKAGLEESQGNLDAALQLYNKVVKIAPDYPYGWSNRGNVQVAKGNLEKAKTDYSQAIEIGLNARDAWVVYLNRGTVYLAVNDAEKALNDFNKASELPSGKLNPIVLQNRAQASERLGDYDSAEKDYAQAISVKPGDLQPFWLRYGLVLYQQKKCVDGLAYAKRILARYPEELEARAAVVAITYDGQGFCEKKSVQSYVQATQLWENREGPINVDGLRLISSREYLEKNLHWPPAAVESFFGIFGNI